MSQLPYKAILFDNDGTLVDTEECILLSFRYMLEKEFGHCSEEDVEKFKDLIGLPSQDQFSKFSNDKNKIESMLKTYRAHNDKILFEMSKNFEGLPETLIKLKNYGYFLGVVTSKRHDVCVRGLEELGIANYFEYIQGPDDWPVHKPDPGALSHACEVLGYKPSEVVYVGDSIYDMESASGAGCDTCAVLWGVFSENKLREKNPTYIARNPEDLLDIFKVK